MFRHERPQKGRYRQFTQLGVEHVGGDHALVDVEVIALAHELLTATLTPQHSAGATHAGSSDVHRAPPLALRLRLNSLGDAGSMRAYGDALQSYFSAHAAALSADSVARLARGAALRILDSKDEGDRAIIAGAPAMHAYLSAAARDRFSHVQAGLDALGIAFELDAQLVRGLDYYRHTIFEFEAAAATSPAASQQPAASPAAAERPASGPGHLGTVLAGGRYDGLCELIGGPKGVPGIGWAAGLERLCLLSPLPTPPPPPACYILPVLPTAPDGTGPTPVAARIEAVSLQVASTLRRTGITTLVDHGGHNLRKQLSVRATCGTAGKDIAGRPRELQLLAARAW
jgi:histidyl-tRNA synthetase